MNSYSLISKLEKFKELVVDEDSLLNIAKKVANQLELVVRAIDASQKYQESGDEMARASARSYVDLIRTRVSEVSPKKIFVAVSSLEDSVNQVAQEFGKDSNPLSGFCSQLEKFNEKYERFFRSHSHSDAIDFIYSANNLIESIETITDFVDSLKENLLGKKEYEESFQEMTIFLNSNYSFAKFIEKLESIQLTYSQLCLLMNVSEFDFPLGINRIESGSLFASIFGESKVIGVLERLIEDAASFLYRKYTTEGKIEAISRQADAVEKVLELSKKLELAGIDTTESKEMIQRSSVIIAGKLNHLLLGEPEIELSGKYISVDSELRQKYIEGSQTYLLESGDS